MPTTKPIARARRIQGLSHTHSPWLRLEPTPPETVEGGGRVVILKQNWDALPRRRGNACWEAHPTDVGWSQIISLPEVPSSIPACSLYPSLCTHPPNPKGHPAPDALRAFFPQEKGRGRPPHSLISLSDIFCHLSGEQASALITAKGERVFKTPPVKIC